MCSSRAGCCKSTVKCWEDKSTSSTCLEDNGVSEQRIKLFSRWCPSRFLAAELRDFRKAERVQKYRIDKKCMEHRYLSKFYILLYFSGSKIWLAKSLSIFVCESERQCSSRRGKRCYVCWCHWAHLSGVWSASITFLSLLMLFNAKPTMSGECCSLSYANRPVWASPLVPATAMLLQRALWHFCSIHHTSVYTG